MGSDCPPCNNADEEYIDMDVSSACSNSSCSTNSEPKSGEFEFQMSAASSKTESTPSPADELFYKGKLLPLHLPPRLQMVEKLLRNSSLAFEDKKEASEDQCDSVLMGNATTLATALNTPLESCSISPSESCRASGELNPDEYFFDWSVEISSFISHDDEKKAWSKKLLQIKESTLGRKLKASKTFLKSLFMKSNKCPDESCARVAYNAESGSRIQAKECLNTCIKVNKIAAFGLIKGRYKKNNTEKEISEDGIDRQRRSFSGVVNWHSGTRTSSSYSSSSSSSISSSFSFNLNRFCDFELQKRISRANYELESSIEGAIAHCKQSHSQERF